MSTFYFPKQPDEQFPISVDFNTNRFNGTESASSQTTTAILISDGSDATATIIDSSTQTAGVVTIIVKAGTASEQYKITTKMTTNEANVYESDMIMKVVSK